MNANAILEVQGLNKKYQNSDFCLSDVSFSLPSGAIMGFVGENKGEIFFTVCLAVAAGIAILTFWLGARAGLPEVIISALIIAVAAVAFVISYHITSKIYAKTDF